MQSAVADLLVATRQCVFLDQMLYGLYIFYALESKQQPRNSFSPHFAARISVHLIVFVFNLYLQFARMFGNIADISKCGRNASVGLIAGLPHQSASISQRYVGKKTIDFMTCRWENSAKRTRDRCELMRQRDVVMRFIPNVTYIINTELYNELYRVYW